jgi:hypothetical protein
VSWLGAKLLGWLPRWGAILAAAALTIGLFVWATKAEKADDRQNQEIGATTERNVALEAAIKNVEAANVVRDEIRASGPVGDRARYDECVRSARTPAKCERYLLPQ